MEMDGDGLWLISIHALREEGDRPHHAGLEPDSGFLSTPSARRATRAWTQATSSTPISIHALREEGDPSYSSC